MSDRWGQYHRDERDYLWIDLRPRLGDGALASAEVSFTRRSGNSWHDVTGDFGDPPVVVSPPETVDETGAAVGGSGWLRIGPVVPGDVALGVYVLKVLFTLSDGRVRAVMPPPQLVVTDRGDPA